MISLGWFVFVTLIFALIQSEIYRRWGLSRLQYMRRFNKKAVFEGEDVELVERIFNRKPLPLPWLRVESKMHPELEFGSQENLDIKHEQYHKSLFSLMPYTGITRRHKVKCKKRGFYRLRSAALTSGELFGVQEVSRTYYFDTELIVYPKILPIDEMPLPSHSWQGDVTIRRWIVDDPFIISGVREYNYGDPLNKINWKATARVGSFQVHNTDFTAQPNILIYLNVDISESMWEAVTDIERIEKGIQYAASIADFAISKGMDVGFGTNAYIKDGEESPIRIRPSKGEGQLLYILEVLAKLEVARSVTFYTFLETDIQTGLTGADIIIMTCFISERMQDQIRLLRDRGNAVEVILLTEEGDIEEAVV
ncbi:MAG: DUF58 domain-containing protein [Clostridiales bacterium]|nr:DUF58 domain-containing protein [Clostridiales bacterium]